MVTGGEGEQPLPGLPEAGTTAVTVRSKDKGSRLFTWIATVSASGNSPKSTREPGPWWKSWAHVNPRPRNRHDRRRERMTLVKLR